MEALIGRTAVPSQAPVAPDDITVSVTEVHISRSYRRVNPQRAFGDGAPITYADQLAGVLVDIFNLALLRSEVLTRFERARIILVPKKSKMTCLNASVIMNKMNNCKYI